MKALTKAQIEAIADLAAQQERDRTVMGLRVQDEARAMHKRHADERAALSKRLGVPLAEADQVAGTTGPAAAALGTTRAAAPVVQNGAAGRARRP